MPKRLLFLDAEKWNVEPDFPMLKDYGIEVDIALNGDQAFKLLQQNQYDLLVLDIVFPPGKFLGRNVEPRKAGELFLKQLRRNEIPDIKTSSDVPIIVIAALTDQRLSEAVKELDVKGFFQKPVLSSQVMDRILALFSIDKSRPSLVNISDLNHMSLYETENGNDFNLVDKLERNMQKPLLPSEKLTNLMRSAYTFNKPQSMQHEKLLENDRYFVEAVAAVPVSIKDVSKILIIVKQVEMRKAEMIQNWVFTSYELQRYQIIIERFIHADEQRVQIVKDKKRNDLNNKDSFWESAITLVTVVAAIGGGARAYNDLIAKGSLIDRAIGVIVFCAAIFFALMRLRWKRKDKSSLNG